MQRLYSLFPAGWPGIALLLLRVSAAVSSILSVSGVSQDRPNWYLWGVILLGAALCAGFLTSFVALLAVAVQLIRFTAPNANPIWLSVTILSTLALGILGPGAYSLDGVRFGRRLLISEHDGKPPSA